MASAGDTGTLGALSAAYGFEVDGGDVVRLVLQFLHEQGLSRAARELQVHTLDAYFVLWLMLVVPPFVQESIR
jgi:hypothetical protein